MTAEVLSKKVDATLLGLTTNHVSDIASLELTKGTWRVSGNVFVAPDNPTHLFQSEAWLSTVSATMPAPILRNQAQFNSTGSAGGGMGYNVPEVFITVKAKTRIYMSVMASFAGGTCGAGCQINAMAI